MRDDLFSIFPDLPWDAHTPSTGQIERAKRQVRDAQSRVGQNSRRQQEAVGRLNALLAEATRLLNEVGR